MDQGFPKQLRLLKMGEFNAVFQKRHHRATTQYLTLLGRINGLCYPRIGILIAKKHVKRAQQRNRLKRLLRESFRRHQNELPALDFLIIAKKGVDGFDNAAFTLMLNTLWQHPYRAS